MIKILEKIGLSYLRLCVMIVNPSNFSPLSMSSDINIITTFQFLEEIQQAFSSAEGDATQYVTRRMVNFFENSATLHVIEAEADSELNGAAEPVAMLWVQSVSKDGDSPTFAVQIGHKPYEKFQKMLVLLQDKQMLGRESTRMVDLLKKAIEKSVQSAQPEAEKAPEVASEPTEESASADEVSSGGARDRLSRRSRLRSRDTDES